MEDPAGAIALYQQVLGSTTPTTRPRRAREAVLADRERGRTCGRLSSQDGARRGPGAPPLLRCTVLARCYDPKPPATSSRRSRCYPGDPDLDPTDYDAIQALDRLYGQAERWPDHWQILERAVEVATARGSRPRCATASARCARTSWPNRPRGRVYRETLAHAADHERRSKRSVASSHGATQPMLAAEVLAPFYEQLAEWEEAGRPLRGDGHAGAGSAGSGSSVCTRSPRSTSASCSSSSKGVRHLRAGAGDRARTDEGTLVQMHRLAEVTGDYEKYARILDEQAVTVRDPLVKAKHAQARRGRAGSTSSTTSRLRSVATGGPRRGPRGRATRSRRSTRSSADLERWQRRWSTTSQRQIRITDGRARVDRPAVPDGPDLPGRMNDLPHAIEAYQAILNVQPDHSPSQQALEFIFYEGEHQHAIARDPRADLLRGRALGAAGQAR